MTTLDERKFDVFREVLEKSGYKSRALCVEDMLLMFLFKLTHNVSFSALSIIFTIPKSTCKDNFRDVLQRLFHSARDMESAGIIQAIRWLENKSGRQVANYLGDSDSKAFVNAKTILEAEGHKPMGPSLSLSSSEGFWLVFVNISSKVGGNNKKQK